MTIKYMVSVLTFYLKGKVESDQRFITFTTPNTILGLIPLGSTSEKVSVNQITSTTTNTKVKLGRLLLGLLFIISAFVGDTHEVGPVLILLILGLCFIINSFVIDLIVHTTSGQTKIINIIIFEKKKLYEIEQMINSMIGGRLDDTNVREQTDRIIDHFSK